MSRRTAAASPTDNPVVDVDGVSVVLGGAPVLQDIDLAVEPGTFVGLVGPNGAGKTTLLRTVEADLAPAAGTVTVAGERIHDLSSKAASRLVATVPQDTSLAFDFSVREAVAMGRTPYISRFGRMGADDHAAVDAALERAAVADLADRPVTEISGGERSRVLLARALAQDTPVLLLDEPTASLDVNHQVRTLELIADLVAEGTTAVAAIHDLNLAARFCDELVLVGDGRVQARGPPPEVLTANRIGRTFDADAVVTEDPVTGAPHVTALSGAEPTDADDAPGRVHVVAGCGRAGPLLSRLAAVGYEVSVGAVPEGDADARVAEAFDMETVSVPPLKPVDERARERVADLVAAADAVVVADVDLTAGVRANLEAARESPRVVCVEDRPLSSRAGDERATERYRSLREGAAVTTGEDLLDALVEVEATVPAIPADD